MERIAVILGNMNRGGVESVVFDYYVNLDYSRYQFDFFVFEDSTAIPYSEITSRGGRVFILPPLKKIYKFKKVLYHYLVEGEYRIMHVHLNTLSTFALKVGKKAGVNVRISHNHSTSNKKEIFRHVVKLFLRRFSNNYVTSRLACSEQAGIWLFGKRQYKKGNINVIKNAIDLERFKFNQDARDTLRAEWGMQDNFIIGNIGRFVPQKNQSFLVDVFKDCVKVNPSCRLVLVGEGKLEKKLIKKIKKYQLEQKVKFVKPCAEVERLYSAFDCLALPSIYEGLGRVVIEAQATGLISVCSTEVPKEVQLTSLVKFATVRSKKKWVETLLFSTSVDREDLSKELRNNGYDIKIESVGLMGWYDSLIDRTNESRLPKLDDKPLISIMVAAFNVESYIKQCIDSALNQTYSNIEIIVVDDGSTDNTLAICKSYSTDRRVKLISQENKGLAEVRNVALKSANGEYVVFIDGDDFVSPFYVQNLYNAIVKTNASMACCDFVKYYDGEQIPVFNCTREYQFYDKKEYIEQTLYQRLECNAWGKLYTKQLALKLEYPRGALYEDLAVFTKLLDEIDNVVVVKTCDYVYRQNGASILHRPFTKADEDCLKFMQNLSEYVKKGFPELAIASNSRMFSVCCSMFLRLNKKIYPKEYEYYWDSLKSLRAQVLKDKKARKKNRCAAFLSYFGKTVFRFAFKFVD